MTNDLKTKVLHITAHLGGGVGNVILNYLKNDTEFDHSVICLDYANIYAKKTAKKYRLKLFSNMSQDTSIIIRFIQESDIVIVHFWNHPLLYDFIVRNNLPPSRIIFWSHISGICPPHNFTYNTLTYPDLFAFNTPIALNNKDVNALSKNEKKNLRVIWATGGIEHLENIKPSQQSNFNIGYIGTVDYVRLRKDFLEISSKIKINNLKFTVCGGLKEKEIAKQADKMGIGDKFTFTGKVDNIDKYLETFDVFAYPLVENHSGTCDLVLQEAMAAGVVPVVFDNPMERHIIKHRITGIIAKNQSEYIEAIEELYQNKGFRASLSKQAKQYAIKHFSIDSMKRDWKNVLEEALLKPKTEKCWPIKKGKDEIKPIDILFEALGSYSDPFKSYLETEKRNECIGKIKRLAKMQIWQGNSKGTIHQYRDFFPDSKELKILSKLMLSLKKQNTDKGGELWLN